MPITEKQLSDASNGGILEYHSFSRRYLCPYLRGTYRYSTFVSPCQSFIGRITFGHSYEFRLVLRYAPFLFAFHLAVSSNAVKIRYTMLGSSW